MSEEDSVQPSAEAEGDVVLSLYTSLEPALAFVREVGSAATLVGIFDEGGEYRESLEREPQILGHFFFHLRMARYSSLRDLEQQTYNRDINTPLKDLIPNPEGSGYSEKRRDQTDEQFWNEIDQIMRDLGGSGTIMRYGAWIHRTRLNIVTRSAYELTHRQLASVGKNLYVPLIPLINELFRRGYNLMDLVVYDYTGGISARIKKRRQRISEAGDLVGTGSAAEVHKSVLAPEIRDKDEEIINSYYVEKYEELNPAILQVLDRLKPTGFMGNFWRLLLPTEEAGFALLDDADKREALARREGLDRTRYDQRRIRLAEEVRETVRQIRGGDDSSLRSFEDLQATALEIARLTQDHKHEEAKTLKDELHSELIEVYKILRSEKNLSHNELTY